MGDSVDNKLRLFNSASSKEYATLIWAFDAVEWCGNCLAKLEKLLDQTPIDAFVCESLWTAAVLRLMSVFDGKYPLDRAILKKMPDGAQEAHTFFTNYRNKHVGHKANPLEQIKIGVLVRPEDQGPKEIISVGHLALHDANFADRTFVRSALQFAAALRTVLLSELENVSGRVLSEARCRPLDEIYALPSARITVPKSDYLHKRK